MSGPRPNAVVTGATSGIGVETARGLARAGYHVVLVARNAAKAAATEADLAATVPGASTEVVVGDLEVMASVRAAAAELLRRLPRIELLVNNAGTAHRRTPTHRTVDDHDPLVATNHLGPFLLTHLLLDRIVASAPARIVNVASHAHRLGRIDLDRLDHPKGYGVGGFRHYGTTKLMNVLFTRELARRLDGTGVTANALSPGNVATRIGAPGRLLSWGQRLVLLSPEEGAATTLHVALSEEGGAVSGSYFAKSARADRKLRRDARDAALARALWDRSAALVGL